jgi:hypothetical protein
MERSAIQQHMKMCSDEVSGAGNVIVIVGFSTL